MTTDAAALPVNWVVARDPDLDEVVVSGRTVTDAGRDHTVKIDVPGLRPGTTYHYGFEADGERSPVGRTRTAPSGEVERLRLAFCSCAKYDDGYFNVYDRIADREGLDLVVHLGDYFYEYATGPDNWGYDHGRAYEPPHECTSLQDYRTRYAFTRREPAVQRLHARHPTVHVFDDHECADDRWREGADNHDPTVDGPFEQRAAAALQAWYEWLPVRTPDPDDPRRIYRRVPWGDLVDLLMIDCRSWRDEQATPPELYDTERVLLGEQQHDWLTERLATSPARWKLVGNPVMVGQVYTNLLPDELAPPLADLGILTESRETVSASPDQWDGYPAARDRLFARIRQDQVRDVVFLSGDVHTSWAVELREDPTADVQPLGVEFVTPSVATENLDEKLDDPSVDIRMLEERVREYNPHIRWCEFDDHGYVVVEATHDRVRAEWWGVETVEEPCEGEELVSAWEVRTGTSRLYAG